MSDIRVEFGVLVLPARADDGKAMNGVVTVDEKQSFRRKINTAKTLHASSKHNDDVSGLAYVPTMPTDGCGWSELADKVPVLRDLPHGYNTVAVAPLTDPACGSAWLQRARRDGARNMIFYDAASEDQRNAHGVPDATWVPDFVNDDPTFSVYYLSATAGVSIMDKMAQYSGNMTAAPYGKQLAQKFDVRDYVRVAVEIEDHATSQLPNLWAFLIIALVVLCMVGLLASGSVHLIQFLSRRRLRRRLETGEIELSNLGIKSITVPDSILRTMPTRRYSADDGSDKDVDLGLGAEYDVKGTEYAVRTLSQPTCAICLDDFVEGTVVRELPCQHIFHTNCIDPFLQNLSPLCPMCKRSALPRGYIPPNMRITNATVRRERRYRRQRERQADRDASYVEAGADEHALNFFRRVRASFPTPPARAHRGSPCRSDDVELHELRRDDSGVYVGDRPAVDQLTDGRGNYVRYSGVVYQENAFEEDRHETRRSGTRRALHLLFPYAF
ncbi:uncharacterized protein V1510DRAFT_401556 [Dipodascopsis tothii]|uniref:uncharacterized protein n=1 Tax=Dipodascopsis tothii TaxID=44089 RepID=UPI0034CFD3D2